MKTVFLKPISSSEIIVLEAFLDLLNITKKYYLSKPRKIEQYEEFKKKITPFLHYPFSEKLRKIFEKTDAEIKKYNDAKSAKPGNIKKFKMQYSSLKKDFLNGGDIDALYSASLAIDVAIKDLTSASKPQEDFIGKTNPFEISVLSSFFSGGKRSGLLSSFTVDEMDDLISKDLSKFKYTYLKLPTHDDYEYMVYFISKLKDSPAPVKIDSSEQKYVIDFKYSSSDGYKALDKLVNDYLFSNDKSIIEKIMADMKQFPELVRLNDSNKRKIKEVYRGLPESEDYGANVNKYLLEDKTLKFVATSTRISAAKNFAQAKGHLDHNANVSGGIIIKYGVNSSSIVLDTSIFGSAFGESEVLIDVTKSKVLSADHYNWDTNRDDNY